ncbi:phosphoglucosamine mutase [Methanopyrus kandleri]|uniref:Probable phosphoglucosamine mutase n=2 Tax=Methanopyrus kandleri TaxID=2320 RepID=GLMM_METKA|nr:phosphoglucosamine mutase [Methanopyrus kandleri]Q8TWY8.1 RecName: Full=Probable phosphoglucosamine mutase [Methanopyrus kandleri AV19]AAM02106.1 Phosphomannomutase [Methanopyrus kandleri AV19]HII69879.1 phosphoglucosamine mutase [Methanopyrus kandleri]
MGKYFGTSGIRGRVGEFLTPELALRAGRALGEYLGGGTVAVGRDTRVHCDALRAAVISGLTAQGCDVVDIGVVCTPTLGCYVATEGLDAGVMITASHNPPEYNGIKFWDSDGMAFSPEQEREIEQIMDGDLEYPNWDEYGEVVDDETALNVHVERILDEVSVDGDGLRIVVDCANGPSAFVTPVVLREMGCEVISLNAHPDGHFPGREPEPKPENLKDLMRTVRATDADLGIAHDGDADRVVFVTEEGKFAGYDEVLALVCRRILEEKGPGKVAVNVDASMVIDEVVREMGGEVVRTKVGDVHVAAAIREEGCVFGGEPNGTWIHPDVHMCPDGPLSAAWMVSLLIEEGRPLSELLAEIPSYPVVRETVECPDELKPEVMRLVETRLREAYDDIDTVDGVRVELDDGWVLVRPSGTEPLIRITVEAESEERARELRDEFVDIVRRCVEEVRE